jgi:2-phospho-L-lactate guanylyltransferase
MRTLAILPVKSFPHAKQRLSDELEPALRQALAEAMLIDVLGGLSEVQGLDGLLVVSPHPRARELAEAHGASALADAEAGHNAAAELGVTLAIGNGFGRALLVPGDCPAIEPSEVDELLELGGAGPSVIVVPDRHGTGTNALLLTPPDAMAPSFGPGSCARHQALAGECGVASQVVELASLALDVDTPEDLDSLARAGRRARHTLELLARC